MNVRGIKHSTDYLDYFPNNSSPVVLGSSLKFALFCTHLLKGVTDGTVPKPNRQGCVCCSLKLCQHQNIPFSRMPPYYRYVTV